MKHKPKGYIAICQCGKTVGAIDLKRTERKEAGKLLGQWVHDGCILQPKFECEWRVTVTSCACDKKAGL